MPQSTALNSNEVDVAVTGAVAFGLTSEAAPTDADTPLGGNYRDVGYIGDSGVVETRNVSTNDIIAWQNSDKVRKVVTDADITVQFTMLQTNSDTLALYYGAEVDPVTGSVKIVPAATGGRRSIVIDYVDGDKFVRLYLPSAEVTAWEAVNHVSGGAASYGVTLTGYPATVGDDTYSAEKFFSELVGS